MNLVHHQAVIKISNLLIADEDLVALLLSVVNNVWLHKTIMGEIIGLQENSTFTKPLHKTAFTLC